MNWTRYSSLIALVGVLVLTAGIAGGVTIANEDTPSSAQVGERITVTYLFEDLYTEHKQWTLHGETNLTNVTWTVTNIDAANVIVNEQSFDSAQFDQPVNVDNDTVLVQVRLIGTTPPVTNYTYTPEETFRVATFTQVREGGTSAPIATFDDTHHYTPESQEARQAIESAQSAIQNASGHQQANQTLANAISAYEAGTFDNAITLANQAEDIAVQSRKTQERNRLLMMIGGVIVVIALLIGGFYWYRANRTGRKL